MENNNYPLRPLADLVEIYDSRRVPVKKADRKPGPYPYYGASGVTDYVDSYIFDGDYLLLAEDGENLKSQNTPLAFLATGKFWVNNHAHILKGKDSGDTRFLCYALNVADIRSYLSGSTRPKLTQRDMKHILVSAPSHPKRHAIARILSSLDDKIELNRKMNATLEAMAQALFKSWFVDFDPVRAKAEGRAPAGMDEETAALFPDAFDEVDGQEVPVGWVVKSLDEIATYLNGLALQKYPAEGEEYLPVVKIAQLRSGNTEGSDKASPDLDPAYIVDDGDVIFSWSGSLTVVLWCGGKGALNQHLFKVTSDRYPKWFYYLWTLQHLPEFQAIAADKATTMGHIQRHHLSDAKVLVPSPDQIEMMDKVLSPLIEKIVANNVQSRTLAALRDTLLPKLISGEVRVPDALLEATAE